MQWKMGTVLRQRRRMLQSPPETLVTVLLGAFLFLPSVPSNAAEQKSAEAAKTPTPPPPTTIPVEEVATQATQVGDLIRGFAANVAPSSEIETIRKFLPQVSVDIALELKNTTDILKEEPSLETLQAQQEIWQQRQSQGTAWLKVLTDHATKLQVALTQLKKLQETWARTRDAQESAQAPPPILQQINTTLAAIEAAQQPHQAQRDEILNLQSQVAKLVAGCNTALAQIAGLQHLAVGGIFTPENPPIWNANLWARAQTMLPERVPKIAASYWGDILLYVRDPSRHLPRHVAIFIALSLVLLAARRQVGQGESGRRPFLACHRSIRSCLCRGVACDLDDRHVTDFAGAGHSEAAFPNRSACANHCAHPAHGDSYRRSRDLCAGNFVRHRYCAAGNRR